MRRDVGAATDSGGGPPRSGVAPSQIESLVAPSRDSGIVRVVAKASRDAGVEPALLGDYLESALAAVARGRRLGRADLDSCREAGETAAVAGIAMSALLDLYLSATWRLWEDIASRAGSAAAPAVATVAGGLFRSADDAAAALAEGYEAAQRQTVRREESLRREFVDDLLAGSGEPALQGERASRFGFNLAGTHLAVVARTNCVLVDAGPVHARVETYVLVTFGGRDVVVATKDGTLVCVVPATAVDPAADLVRILDETGEGPWQVGVGRPYTGPGGLVRSYSEARETLELARRLGLTDPLVRFKSLLPYRILGLDPITMAEMVQGVLGPLQAARGGAEPLIETLEAYFASSGNGSATARRLHLSPRAVVYRLQRIAQLTGHAADEPEGRFVLELAVRARRMLDRS